MNTLRIVLLMLLCLSASSCVATAQASPEPLPPSQSVRFTSYHQRHFVVVDGNKDSRSIAAVHDTPVRSGPSRDLRGKRHDHERGKPHRAHQAGGRKAHGQHADAPERDDCPSVADDKSRNAREHARKHGANSHKREPRAHDQAPDKRRGKLKTKRGKRLPKKSKHQDAAERTH